MTFSVSLSSEEGKTKTLAFLFSRILTLPLTPSRGPDPRGDRSSTGTTALGVVISITTGFSPKNIHLFVNNTKRNSKGITLRHLTHFNDTLLYRD